MAAYSNLHISKRAADMEKLKQEILGIWRDNEGPFQNIFRLFSYAMPFIPGLGWVSFLIEGIASAFGYGLSDLGAFIDKELGLSPGVDFNTQEATQDVSNWFAQIVDGKMAGASLNDEQIVKVAFLGTLLKMIGGGARIAPIVFKVLTSLIGWLLMSVGANHISDIYKMAKERAKGVATDVMKEQFSSPEDLLGLLTQSQE